MCQQSHLLSYIASFLFLTVQVTPANFYIFGNSPNEFILTDDTPSDHLVGKVHTPLDKTITFPNSDSSTNTWSFRIFRSHKLPDRLFRIDVDSGELYTHELIDREVLCPNHEETDCTLTFQVAAQSNGSHGVPHFVDVSILLADRNDHIPSFPEPGFVNLTVPESMDVGARFPLPLARDPDTRQYSVSAYVAQPKLPDEWALVTESVGSETGEAFMFPKTSPPSKRITGLFLELQKPLDYEKNKQFLFGIQAVDGLEVNKFPLRNNRKDILKVYIHIEDINDNGPVFRPQRKSYPASTQEEKLTSWMVKYVVTVPESIWIKDPILKLVADDLDGPTHSKVTYYFAPATIKEVQEYFTLNPLNGYLFLRKPLDYELQSEFSFRVIATDTPEEGLRGNIISAPSAQSPASIHTSTAQVVITVTDTNDEAPVIEVDFISSEPIGPPLSAKYAEIEENVTPPQFIAIIQATDRDAGLNGQVSCSLQCIKNRTPSNGAFWSTSVNLTASSFQLDEIRQENGRVQYRLLTKEALDREDVENGGGYRQLKVICTDAGQPARSSSTLVSIRILDQNDNAPQIVLQRPLEFIYSSKIASSEKWPFIYENSPIGSLVIRLNASDMDEGENGRLSFSFEADDNTDPNASLLGLFQINEKTGDITTRAEIDREGYEPPLSSLTLRVKVSDNGKPPRSVIQEVRIHILDENDNGPFFQQSEYRFHVMENLPAGYAIGEVMVTDKDEGDVKLSFGMQSYGPLPFVIWPSPFKPGNDETFYSMTRFILNTTRSLDREMEHSYKFTLLATDGSSGVGNSRIGTATVTVEIIVENENDNDPVIIFPQKQNKTFYLSWGERKNFELLTVNANDRDSSENPQMFELAKDIYDVSPNNQTIYGNHTLGETVSSQNSDFLDIEPTTGIVFLSRDMRVEDKGVHVFKVQVTDGGVPPRSSSITFFVLVDGSTPRSSLQERQAPVIIRPDDTPKDNTGLKTSKDASVLSSQSSNLRRSQDIRLNAKPRVASDLIILLALGLVFLLLIATLSLVVYLRYWKKQARLGQFNRNRASLMFANQVNGGGSTCMKEIRVPSTKLQQEQWLCTGKGSIINGSTPTHMLTEGDPLKNHFAMGLSSSGSVGNIYYKAQTNTLRNGRDSSDHTTAYSSLSPMTSVFLKPSLVSTCDSYLHPDQLAYYSQNIHVVNPQSSERAVLLPHKSIVERNTPKEGVPMSQRLNEVFVLPAATWDTQSRSDSLLKNQHKPDQMVPSRERRSREEEPDVSPFCSPFA